MQKASLCTQQSVRFDDFQDMNLKIKKVLMFINFFKVNSTPLTEDQRQYEYIQVTLLLGNLLSIDLVKLCLIELP